MTGHAPHIRAATTPRDIEAARGLFLTYAASLGIGLDYQDFDAELAGLPGKYAPPQGALLLASHDARMIGCVAMRPLASGVCEMKRLYVTPQGRGLGVGRALIDAVLSEARRLGYGEMKLDTLPQMTAAIALYQEAGFAPAPAYYDTPIAGTLFMARTL
ncbi:GNAT family N-acetyltransferase [Asticcacaulis sp. EMRT-3]|uniref:GNAT family N-acetyltransferase n=1 Tax=Asticcacaulis sp. EMRT-3 TaxID=3040349 RepID=UPI0024AE9683|nr:GNAT family N-acetyltransferase [Asticcacaulis sp. EMRT-3]MDI7775995.1 GNAT family N-acetyltransferase [Asticcacaulis sp. EMRT-3]